MANAVENPKNLGSLKPKIKWHYICKENNGNVMDFATPIETFFKTHTIVLDSPGKAFFVTPIVEKNNENWNLGTIYCGSQVAGVLAEINGDAPREIYSILTNYENKKIYDFEAVVTIDFDPTVTGRIRDMLFRFSDSSENKNFKLIGLLLTILG